MGHREICEKLKRAKALIEDVEWELKELSTDTRRNYRDSDRDSRERRDRFGY